MANRKILIAEDTAEVRMLVRIYMEGESYELLEAEDGVEAVKLAAEQQPDVILMDIMMPIMDGIEATLKIKNNPKTKNIPIIMLTAVLDSEAVLTSYDYGADNYLNKPFTKEQLISAINFAEKMGKRGV
jgi:CheY-like chemotaxis protein